MQTKKIKLSCFVCCSLGCVREREDYYTQRCTLCRRLCTDVSRCFFLHLFSSSVFLFSPATVIHIRLSTFFSQHFIDDCISRGCVFTACLHERVSESFKQRFGNWLTANDGEQLRNEETLHVNSWQIVVFFHYDLNCDASLSQLFTNVTLIAEQNYLQIAMMLWYSIARRNTISA